MSGTFHQRYQQAPFRLFRERGTEGQVHQPVITVNQCAQFCYRQDGNHLPITVGVQGGQGQVFIIQCCSVVDGHCFFLVGGMLFSVVSVGWPGFGGFGGFTSVSVFVVIMAAGITSSVSDQRVLIDVYDRDLAEVRPISGPAPACPVEALQWPLPHRVPGREAETDTLHFCPGSGHHAGPSMKPFVVFAR